MAGARAPATPNVRDQYDAPFAAIISKSLARQSFGSTNPIGRRLYCGLDSPYPMMIVGVVGDVRQNSPASSPEAEIYMLFQQHPAYANELQIVARTSGDALGLVPPVRRIMQRLAPDVATNFTSLSAMVDDSISAPRFRAMLAIAFAVVAALLAMTGIYSVMAYHVAERRSEIGLRMALGARPAKIIQMVFGRVLMTAGAGLTLGIAIAVALSQLVHSLLFEVSALDPALPVSWTASARYVAPIGSKRNNLLKVHFCPFR